MAGGTTGSSGCELAARRRRQLRVCWRLAVSGLSRSKYCGGDSMGGPSLSFLLVSSQPVTGFDRLIKVDWVQAGVFGDDCKGGSLRVGDLVLVVRLECVLAGNDEVDDWLDWK
ncbi:hypothetical protein M0R45_000447 [Rubus argutus]|uniref:Peptidylprolyl isomerase n=1 Tax=Rubus argutus TaxID=59490 RepID=A0AAW1VPD9_RUBAR